MLVTATVPPEGLLCSCSTSCSPSPLAFQPITTWFDCQPSLSRAFCRTGHLSPYLSRSQSRACSAGCLASETRQAGGSSSPCRPWTDQAWCDSRCRPPPSHRRAALHTRASLSSTSPSQRTLIEPRGGFPRLHCALDADSHQKVDIVRKWSSRRWEPPTVSKKCPASQKWLPYFLDYKSHRSKNVS